MSTPNLIIYKFKSLYHVLVELSLDFNFKIVFSDDEKSLKTMTENLKNYLIISNKIHSNFKNQCSLENTPITIFKLKEKVNIEFLKIKFNNQSKLNINSYHIDFNSRKLIKNNIKLKLTEKEISVIDYLYKSNEPIKVEQLQEKVWGYRSDIETHTVETHIYRLRKKIIETFNDNKFITSEKNGYKI